ncbi:MAG: hypothetical protein H6907_20320 [Hyphomicrobiales bacterium]|nr:hypothetical protein [Hyphomicrobiales bacterium]
MRYLGFVAVYVICTWVLIEVPWPLDDSLSDDIGLTTASGPEDNPPFERVAARLVGLDTSGRQPLVREDPRLGRLRQDVVRAGDRLRQDVCDADRRAEFADAVLAFAWPVEEMNRDTTRLPAAERVVLNGQEVSTTMHLNTEALETIAWARSQGAMYREDVPEDLRWLRRYLFSRDDRIVARALSPRC